MDLQQFILLKENKLKIMKTSSAKKRKKTIWEFHSKIGTSMYSLTAVKRQKTLTKLTNKFRGNNRKVTTTQHFKERSKR